MNLTYYQTVKGTVNLGNHNLDFLKQTILNNPNQDLIDLARSGQADFSVVKSALPVISPHGTFLGAKKDLNIKTLSGLIIIDIDNPADLNQTKDLLFSLPEIVGVWTSVSGKGIHAIASLDGLTIKTFVLYHKAYLDRLEQEYDIVSDRKVCFLSACLIISSDKLARFKDSWESLSVLNLEKYTKRKPPSIILDRLDGEMLLGGLRFSEASFRFKLTLPEYPRQVMYFPEGKPYFSCFLPFDEKGLPKKIQEGSRQYTLSCFLNNLIILNPNKSSEQFTNLMMSINKTSCSIPLEKWEIEDMVNPRMRRIDNLKPIKATIKYYWVDPSAGNKLSLLGKFRREYTLSKIEEFFGDTLASLEKKVTKEVISEYTGLSRPTINKHLSPDMKLLMKQHNESLRNKK